MSDLAQIIESALKILDPERFAIGGGRDLAAGCMQAEKSDEALTPMQAPGTRAVQPDHFASPSKFLRQI